MIYESEKKQQTKPTLIYNEDFSIKLDSLPDNLQDQLGDKNSYMKEKIPSTLSGLQER